MKNIGSDEVFQAEAWGLFTSLQLAKQLDISNLVVESNSSVLISLLQSPVLELHPLGTIDELHVCMNIMNNFAACSLRHIHRERNVVAYSYLTKNKNAQLHIC